MKTILILVLDFTQNLHAFDFFSKITLVILCETNLEIQENIMTSVIIELYYMFMSKHTLNRLKFKRVNFQKSDYVVSHPNAE